MDFEEIVKKRQSCRSYDPSKKVEGEKILACLEATRLAPSACNSQPYRIYAVSNSEKAERLSDPEVSGMSNFVRDCSTFVIFVEDDYNEMAEMGVGLMGIDYRSIDIGIASAYFTAAATEQGLDTCILGAFHNENVKKILGTDADVKLAISVGYRKAGDPLRDKKRKPFDDIVEMM
ncbi:MAG TPA: nitroreductase family protein [Candidatus Methanomethylophilaceae archaeon]|nr:nitroreductase family protein [Candidatus Methanomethylophilaceae archaeon]